METLKEYINREHGGSQVRFSEYAGVSKQQVNRWLAMGCIVVNGNLYSKRRPLKKET